MPILSLKVEGDEVFIDNFNHHLIIFLNVLKLGYGGEKVSGCPGVLPCPDVRTGQILSADVRAGQIYQLTTYLVISIKKYL